MNGAGSRSCPMAGLGISGIESSGSPIIVFIQVNIFNMLYCLWTEAIVILRVLFMSSDI
jgi:ABC-type transport system involved in multi-copper enzyme maturation permease subunit